MSAYEKEAAKDPELKKQSTSSVITTKFWQWGFASFTAAMDFASSAMERMSKYGLRSAQGPVFKKVTEWVKGTARGLGTVAAALSAAVDWSSYKNAKKEGKTGLATAYLASFGISFAAFALSFYTTLTYFFSTTGVATAIFGVSITGILIVLAIAAIVAMVLVMEEDRKANIKEWLLRSIFGKEEAREKLKEETGNEVKEYSSLYVEEAALKGVFS
jgi:hypothetical protein